MNSEKKSKTILLVENESDVSKVVSKILKKSGYNVITADSGGAAVEIALRNDNPDLILMDIDLGDGFDGTEAARRILQVKEIPIVFHTSHSEQEMVEKVHGITRYGYVIKSSGNFVLQSSIEMAFELFEANKKIKKSEKLFRGLFNNSLNAVALIELIYDEESKITDGIILAINPVFEKCTGLKSENVEGKLYTEVYPDVLKTGNIQKLDEKLRRDEPYFSEVFYKPTGKYFNFTAHEIDKGLIAIVMEDITGEKQAIKSLIENEVKLKSFSLLNNITENIPACVACVNAATLKYEFVNRVYGETFDIRPEIIIGMSVKEIIGNDAFMNALPYIKQACNGEKISYENMIPAKGELRCYNVNYIPLANNHDNIQYLIILAIDITERKISENKINMLLKEKEILIKEVHHRIKNNMSTIAGILFLHSDSIKDPSAVSALQDAESRVHSMMVLYDKLYRSDNFTEMPILEYLTPLVDEIICSLHNNRTIKIEKKIADFVVDSRLLFPLGIIVNELMTNIIKHAFNDRNTGLIIISASAVNGRAVISIKDNGIGLPENYDIKHSSGFGLSLIEMLIEQIDGVIKIENDNGTEFIIEFGL